MLDGLSHDGASPVNGLDRRMYAKALDDFGAPRGAGPDAHAPYVPGRFLRLKMGIEQDDFLGVDLGCQLKAVAKQVWLPPPDGGESLRLVGGQGKLAKKSFFVHHIYKPCHVVMISMNGFVCNAWGGRGPRLWALLMAAGLGMGLAGRVEAKRGPAASAADMCRAVWEEKWGALREVAPSRLSGLREMQMEDGNILFIDKSCEHVILGEVISRRGGTPPPRVFRLDRSGLRLGQLVSVGPAKRSASWVFVVAEEDVERFTSQMKARPEWDRAGYYVGIVKNLAAGGEEPGCRVGRAGQIEAAARQAACGGGLDLGLLGALAPPFAIAPDGAKVDFSWAAGLPAGPRR